jgi:RNA polymerase sigma factor (sigma-70 family)
MAESSSPEEYAEFIRRIRQGDQEAAAELVRLYEPEIRLEIRGWLRLRDPRLRRVLDSVDVCQAVLASFFLRATLGEFDLEQPGQLIQLLVGMARNKLSEQVRHHQRQRRDVRRLQASADEVEPAAAAETPSQVVTGQELLAEFRKRLTEEERQLAELRAEGHDWQAIADKLGGTAEGRRKQLMRAVERVEEELGLSLPS